MNPEHIPGLKAGESNGFILYAFPVRIRCGAAGSGVCGATDKSAAERLGAALLGNI